MWVRDFTLFIDCVSFGDYVDDGDLQFIQLCTTLGWVSKVVLIPIEESYSRFYGEFTRWYQKACLQNVLLVLHHLGPVPYAFDEEYCHEVEPCKRHKFSL